MEAPGGHRRRRHRAFGGRAVLLVLSLVQACTGSHGSLASRLAVDLETAAATGSGDAAALALRALDDPEADSEVRCAAWDALGRVRGREGNRLEAVDWLARVGRECAQVPRISSEALRELARLAGESRTSAGRQALVRLVRSFPDEPAAAQGVRELALGNPAPPEVEARVALLQGLYRRVEGREVAPVILWEAAGLLRGLPGREPAVRALGLYRLLAKRYPGSGLRDDALWAAGRLSLDFGDPAGALDCFEELRSLQEWSFLFGSYEKDLYREALQGMSQALRWLGRPAEAAEMLERLARERPRDASRLLQEAASLREQAPRRR